MFQYTSEICFQTNNCAYYYCLFSDSSATLSLMNRIQIDYEIEFRKKLMHKGIVIILIRYLLYILFSFLEGQHQSFYYKVFINQYYYFKQQQDQEYLSDQLLLWGIKLKFHNNFVAQRHHVNNGSLKSFHKLRN